MGKHSKNNFELIVTVVETTEVCDTCDNYTNIEVEGHLPCRDGRLINSMCQECLASIVAVLPELARRVVS